MPNESKDTSPNFIPPGQPTRAFLEQNPARGRQMFDFSRNVNFVLNDPLTGKPPEKDPRRDAEMALRQRSTRESLNDDLLGSAKDPFELYFGMRRIFRRLESGTIPPSLSENFRPPSQLTGMIERCDDLSMTGEELVEIGFLTHYDPKTGLGIPVDSKFSIMAMDTDLYGAIPGASSDQILDVSESNRANMVPAYYYGIPEKRVELKKAYERAQHEMEARAILGEWVGVMLNLNIRDSLEALVNWEHGTTAKFKAEHLEALFNMPDLKELKTNSENHTLGDQVEEALFLNLVMLHSGNKQRMLDFLERPGANYLIARLAKKEESRTGRECSPEKWVSDNIGDVKKWEDDDKRDLETTWKKEMKDGRRKRLTKWGNMAAFGGNPGDIGENDETDFIEKDVGGLVGSVEASWIAASLMRAIGTYASQGYVELPNGKSILPLGEFKFITSDDRGKFFAYMYNFKEGTKNRKYGLKGMLGKIPDMAFDLFEWAQVAMDDLPPDEYGIKQRRSIWDAWLGTAGGKDKISLLTGKPSGNKTSEESYHRLGDLNFHSLDRDFCGTFGTMQWLIGREDDGVFTNAMNVRKFNAESFALDSLLAITKYVGITQNLIILTKGSPHLYDDTKEAIPIIQKNFFRNQMLARMHSAHFSMNILNSEVKLFNPVGPDILVKTPLWIAANVKEILGKKPENYKELLDRFIDENKQLRTLGKPLPVVNVRTPGLDSEVTKLMNEEKFLPENKAEIPYMQIVGIVRGR